MTAMTTRAAEMTVPVATFTELRTSLAQSVGADEAAEALRQAGYAAGDRLHRVLLQANRDAGVSTPVFWHHVEALFASRGWGHLRFGRVHTGVGVLDAADWFEAEPGSDADSPTCHFTTGVLANLLGNTAGEPVAVLEVECRSRGDERCRFAFGGLNALSRVYEELASGGSLDSAVARLG